MTRRQRGRLWTKLFQVEQATQAHSLFLYSKLLQFDNPAIEQAICRDVTRTLTDLQMWYEDFDAGNNKLFNVLKAYANYDSEVGYVQGNSEVFPLY